MNRTDQNIKVQIIIDKYFADNPRKMHLKAGEYLMKKDEHNNKLYLILEGELYGYFTSEEGIEVEMFRISRGMFAGVYSFFSGTQTSFVNIIAKTDCELSYITEYDLKNSPYEDGHYIEEFMAVAVNELRFRHESAQKLSLEKEITLKKLVQTERLASLGQMAASIAHELNNSISILQRNSDWIASEIMAHLKESYPLYERFYEIGLFYGRTFSSREIRERTREIQKILEISGKAAKKLANANLNVSEFEEYKNLPEDELDKIVYYWEIGASIHDMQVASEHSVHVVKSVRQLGAPKSEKLVFLKVNETIHEAILLLKGKIESITLDLELADVSEIAASKGEMIQIWLNLIKNAIESLHQSKTKNPKITIKTFERNSNIVIEIIDNGPGIPEDIRSRIFQPNFTTKVEGLNFGLGLGLSIVQRIIQSYRGDIFVQSVPGFTKFTVKLLSGERNG